ncbi:hypothetical protein B566_EDAN012981 [Ephemera danica]|nr:hypothetical protein B566_EDAN012981 [Ephemera danica]
MRSRNAPLQRRANVFTCNISLERMVDNQWKPPDKTMASPSGGRSNRGGMLEFAPRRSKPRKPIEMEQPLRERKPNIILILTDDQDVELGSLNFMPRTQRLLRDEGAEFRHAYVTTPMCCPSRSSMLTGMLVFTNNDNCSGNAWQATHETRTFATYLSNAGYRTGYFGKYLNKYNGSYIPPGWREWAGLIMNSRYYNYSVNVNGKRIKHGADYQRDYYPDLIANDSVAFLRHSKQSFSRKPVMLVMSFPAPHGPEDSAPQYSHLFFNVTTHHTPAYDYAPNPDKQWILRVTGRMQPIHKRFTDLLMTKRLQTLQSVDSAVQKVYTALQELGELDNTYIFYTSDHGYHLGQFGLVKGKSFPFEFDIRVPFLVRGPGVEAGTIVDDIVLNVDLAPTFLDVAGVEAPPHMDGRSLLPLIHRGGHKQPRRRRSRWPDTFLVESSGRRELHIDNQAVSSKVARLNQSLAVAAAAQHPILARLDQEERRMQRNFLRTHLSPHHEPYKPRFLKSPPVLSPLRRRRRSLSALLDSLLGGVTQQIQGLEEQTANDSTAFSANEEQEVELPVNVTGSKCRVIGAGRVNCSRAVYRDSRVWRRSKQKIDEEINRLREQLEALKEIRRHLRHKRPPPGAHEPEEDDDDDDMSNEDEEPDETDDDDDDETVDEDHDDEFTEVTMAPSATEATTATVTADLDNFTTQKPLTHLGTTVHRDKHGNMCICEPDPILEARRRQKEQRLRRKLRKKSRMKQECLSEKMNCFTHDNSHWRTAPLWTDGPFCVCMNANNNTYSCLRTINATHNFLFCEFTTGLVTFYNLRIDPFEQWNRAHALNPAELASLRAQLAQLKSCRGARECRSGSIVEIAQESSTRKRPKPATGARQQQSQETAR